MKFIKEHLTSITGIEWFPIIGLLIFVGIFLGALYWAFAVRKDKVEALAALPLED